MKIGCAAPNTSAARTGSAMGSAGDGPVRREGRLSLRKGDGEGEGLSGEICGVLGATPHLGPLPFFKGRGGQPGRVPRKI
jgi:hypothetical protein